MEDNEEKVVNDSWRFTAGLLVGLLVGIISIFIYKADHPDPEPCDDRALLKIIHDQDSVIQKYSAYKNWFREMYGIDTTKLEQFKHKTP